MRRTDREVRAQEELAQILNQCKTASIAMIDGDTPYVVPLSYGYEMTEDSLVLYFHCAKQGRKLDVLEKNSKVCFAIFSEGIPVYAETPCNSGYYYSSIIGNGNVEMIVNDDEKCYALSKMFEHQSGKKVEFTLSQAETVCVFKIVSKDYTGKRKPVVQ